MTIDIEELKRLAEINAGWRNVNCSWMDAVNEGAAIVGHIDEDGNEYDVAVVDVVQYDVVEAGSAQLASFYAAANPAAVLELIAEIERLRESRGELLGALKGMAQLDRENHQRGDDDIDISYEVQAAYNAIANAEKTK